ncbi:hypothetical protein [Syntrophotalea acetylenica]|uniref:Uncharacterized protein n=1 Tax=Syntrophotalea acetylenica TaxID=29542 RepID=A0A1L3GJ64_SYNAC|nr:hypothetical protein [Syntrophotalea acetylenica]APG25959.1 hypothetical protein A7E75_13800 [Syntrophotalea acetylenica]APG44027.1 hypothetical protein A6070_07825 [Syntrophotalea acetylenica]
MKRESALLKKLKFLKISLVVSWICYGIMVILGVSEDSGLINYEILTVAAIVLWLIIFIMGILFIFSLGGLAGDLNRSGIVWIGLSIITAPIGPIVAFSMMRNIVNTEIHNTQMGG